MDIKNAKDSVQAHDFLVVPAHQYLDVITRKVEWHHAHRADDGFLSAEGRVEGHPDDSFLVRSELLESHLDAVNTLASWA